MADEETEGKGFVIKDRRRFAEEGEGKEKARPETKGEQADTRAQATRPEAAGEALLPEITFATFIFSLNTSALVHLGDYPDPATGKSEMDLPLAKQTIDLIALLEEKTRGNLTKDEENLVRHILYDLRLRYVQKAR
ncbi:MAG TPA: DUF1844 domain-containing protein [Syntrophobacteria bacterium]|nr:DUF1844 domain-containing protein [Syntrophobacteria bacterium]